MYKEGALTGEKMREAAISWKDVFDEIPINVHSSPLATALLHSIEPDTVADSRDFARLDLSVGPLLEKNLEFLNDCMDDIVAEQQKVCAENILNISYHCIASQMNNFSTGSLVEKSRKKLDDCMDDIVAMQQMVEPWVKLLLCLHLMGYLQQLSGLRAGIPMRRQQKLSLLRQPCLSLPCCTASTKRTHT